MNEDENLMKWRDSGGPHRWVWGCAGVWSQQEYAGLLESLRSGPYWPLKEEDVCKALEKAADTYHDLKRWNLLAEDAQDRAEDDEIFF